jgi:hypothetical protein
MIGNVIIAAIRRKPRVLKKYCQSFLSKGLPQKEVKDVPFRKGIKERRMSQDGINERLENRRNSPRLMAF